MSKNIFAVVTAAILCAAVVSTGAYAFTTDAGMQGKATQDMSLKRAEGQLQRDRMLLRQDVRLGKTTEAAQLRRQINADERAITRAKEGMQQRSAAGGVQPVKPNPMQNQTTPGQNNTPTQNKP